MGNDELFGLKMEEIRPIVERAVGSAVARLTFSFRHTLDGHPGYQGQKAIPTFAYATADGREGELVVFVKRHGSAERIESSQYQHLQEQNAPIARLYGSLRDREGRDVLFLEFLPRVYRNDEVFGSPDLLRRFIRLTARLNALPVTRAYEELPRHGKLHGIPLDQLPVVARIAEQAPNGELGPELRSMFRGTPDLQSRLAGRLEALSEVTSRFPLAVVHGDLWPFQAGSREGSDEMLAFDLGWSLLASRFFDVAPFVGPSDDVEPMCLSRDEIADCYLEHFAAESGRAVARKDFLVEADAVWMAWNSRRIVRLAGPAAGGDRPAQKTLHWLLTMLDSWQEGEQLPTPRVIHPGR